MPLREALRAGPLSYRLLYRGSHKRSSEQSRSIDEGARSVKRLSYGIVRDKYVWKKATAPASTVISAAINPLDQNMSPYSRVRIRSKTVRYS